MLLQKRGKAIAPSCSVESQDVRDVLIHVFHQVKPPPPPPLPPNSLLSVYPERVHRQEKMGGPIPNVVGCQKRLGEGF